MSHMNREVSQMLLDMVEEFMPDVGVFGLSQDTDAFGYKYMAIQFYDDDSDDGVEFYRMLQDFAAKFDKATFEVSRHHNGETVYNYVGIVRIWGLLD